jgi:transcriptional regulator with XRE-family HTH domain
MALTKREFARRLRAARERLDIRQEDAARRIGTTWATYQRWESGKTSPRPGKIEAIAQALEVDIEHLQGAEEDTETTLQRVASTAEANARAAAAPRGR